jgi:hypothetical protein
MSDTFIAQSDNKMWFSERDATEQAVARLHAKLREVGYTPITPITTRGRSAKGFKFTATATCNAVPLTR